MRFLLFLWINILITPKEEENMEASNYFSTNFHLSFLEDYKTLPGNLWQKNFLCSSISLEVLVPNIKNWWQLLIEFWCNSPLENMFMNIFQNSENNLLTWGASSICKGHGKLGYIPYGLFGWLVLFQSYSTGWDKGGHMKLTQIRDFRPLQWLCVTSVTFCTSF